MGKGKHRKRRYTPAVRTDDAPPPRPDPSPRPPPRPAFRAWPWLCLLAAAAAYANALGAGFTLDDVPIVEKNPLVQDLAKLPTIWTSHYWAGKDNPSDTGLFRPLTLTTYALQHAVHGLSPGAYHAANVLFHALTTLMLFLLVRLLFGDSRVAGVAALLFAAHPVHAEAVVGIVGRAELLSLLGMLLCCWAYFRGMVSARGGPAFLWIALAMLAYASAMLSKEGGLLAPIVILMTELLLPRRRYLLKASPAAVTAFAGLAIVALVVWSLRSTVTTGVVVHEKWVGVAAPERMLTGLRVCMEYVGLLVAPRVLSADYWSTEVPLARSLLESGVAGALVLLVLAALLCAYCRRRAPAVTWGLCFFALTLFPLSNLPFALGVLKAERILYAPSAGFLVAVAGLLSIPLARQRWRLPVWCLVAVLTTAYAARTWARNRDWHDNRTLAEATLRTSPHSPRFHVIMAQERSGAGRHDEARIHLERSLDANPYHVTALNNLGLVYRELGDLEGAARTLERILDIEPDQYQAYVNLMAVYRDLKAHEESLVVADEAIRRFPDKAAVHWNRANLLLLMGRKDEAEAGWTRAREIDPAIGR